MSSNIRFYMLCLFYCLWIQAFPFTLLLLLFIFWHFVSFLQRATTLFLSLCFFSLSLSLSLNPLLLLYIKLTVLSSFFLSYCLLCFSVVGAVKFLHEKCIAFIQNVFVSLGGSIWVDDGKAVDNEMWVGSFARTVDTFSCSVSCMHLHCEKKWEQMRMEGDGAGGEICGKETQAKCLKNHLWQMYHREVR